MTTPLPSRRIVFQGLSALGIAAVLAGCGDDDNGGASDDPTTESTPSETPPGSTPSATTTGAAEGIATTAEVPVGGGIVLREEKIVITQPTAGQFVAFSAVCTHQKQTVGEVADGTISCFFHGSKYDAATGAVTGGPAPAPLAKKTVRVEGDQIFVS